MFHVACRAALEIGLSRPHEGYSRTRNDKEPADEHRMMENHSCYGNGGGGVGVGGAGRVTRYL